MKIINSRIIETVRELGLPEGEYAVFGSALLEIYGLREGGDIDLVVTRGLFEELGEMEGWERFKFEDGGSGVKKLDGGIEALYYCESMLECCSEKGIIRMIREGVSLGGVNFVSLEDTIIWKRELGREKDLRDVELIKKFFEKEEG